MQAREGADGDGNPEIAFALGVALMREAVAGLISAFTATPEQRRKAEKALDEVVRMVEKRHGPKKSAKKPLGPSK